MKGEVNKRFKEAFLWTELTSNALATKLNMNARTVWSYTDGGRDASYECVSKMCQLFPELNFDWIMYGKGNMLKGTPVLDGNGEPAYLSQEQLAPSSKPQDGIASKVEEMYERIISMLQHQLDETKNRCSELEEQNKILLSLMPKNNDSEK